MKADNEDLQNELEYFSEDYDEEQEMEPRPEPNREATLTLRPMSPVVRRQRERVVGFEEAPNKEGSRRGRNAEGIRPSKIEAREDENRGVNLPPLLAAHLGRNESGSFADSTGSVTHFVRWIEDYPLPNGLKMPSHIGSYNGKGDPDNFLHLFEGAIRMQKWLMPVACHIFTYTLKDSARIWWNSQKTCSILNYEGLKAKFWTHFSASTRAFITRYTDDTLQILGLYEEQRIFGFVHGLRTRSLVEHLSTDLASIYKGLMEKTYTWIEAREVATNGSPNDPKGSFERSKKSFRRTTKGRKSGIDRRSSEIRAAGSLGKRSKEEREGIDIVLSQYNPRDPEEERRATSEEHQEEVKDILSCVDAEERIVVNDQYPEQKIVIGRQLPTKIKIRLQGLMRAYADVFAWTTAHMTGVPRTIIIGGEAFNTEHRVNELKHLEPVKQKKRSLAPERNKAIHTQVEELTKANILREVKYQTWVSNPVIVKKANERWKLCVDFTDINKACPKEHHSLPMIEQKVEDLHRHRLKCFLDAYKGYHQIPIAEKHEEKTAFYTREGVLCYRRLPFSLKNAGATYQRLIDKLFNHQLRRKIEVNSDDIVIKKDGIFSRQLITKQGIKANPSKLKAISDLQPPKSINEIQNLNRKLAALNCFLSKGADKTLPFMRTLKSCTSAKMVQWTTEADEAFRRMKELLEALPMVTTPIKGETLIMYLAASEESISAVLMAERGRNKFSCTSARDRIQRKKFRMGQILSDFLAETPSKEEEGAKDEEAKRKEIKPEKHGNCSLIELQAPMALEQDNGWNAIPKIILVAMVKMWRRNTGQKHHPRSTSRFMRNARRSTGIDIVGPLLIALGGARFLVVAIDYFTKWVEAKPLTSTTGKHMERFVWEHIVCRILQSLTSVYHPQANGQVEVTNREIVKGMERSLVYSSEAVIPIEISIETRRIQDFDPKQNEKRCREDLDILKERREIDSIKEARYKQKLEGYYNKRVRPSTFKPGTYVLRLNSASKSEFQGKMGPTWEGPYIVKKAYGDGAYKLETLSGSPIDRT
ncbi:reverse transcriptase domain-containing protein [Tanacetum coccineum]|uniref:Reverse transcriptase domain-containing protein n=1 Tax=Tanacetum coccineum TaxID=301880 RepID=A0ABQ5A7F0_9ASTR